MTDSFDPQQPRVPGVRYGKETRYRPVTTTVFGEEHTDYEPYQVDVPLPPRDWDRCLMRFLLAVAFGSTAVAVVWSTASISGLLSLVVTTTGIAVAAASLFELLWIVCLVAEHLLLGQPDRAQPMRVAGWIAVAVVVAAVVVEGFQKHHAAAGIVGGAVSLMAKGSWWVVFRVRQVKLRRPVAQALQRKLEDVAAAETLLAFKHRLGGRQAYAALTFGEGEYLAAQATVQASNRAEQMTELGYRPDASGQPVQTPPAPPAPPAPPVPPAQPAPPVPPAGAPAPTPASNPQSAPTAPVPPMQPTGASAPSGQNAATPPYAPVGLLSVAAATRQVIADKGEGISDQDLIDAVGWLVGKERAKSPKFPETVLRNRRTKDKIRKPQARSAP